MEKLDRNDVRLESLVFDAAQGGVDAPRRQGYRRLHPEIYEYDASFIDPLVRAGDLARFIHEDAEQIYRWRFLTPDFCAKLVEEAEHSDEWETRSDVEDSPLAADGVVKNYAPRDTTQWLDRMPGLERVYLEIVRRHLEPIIYELWPVFRIQRMKRPYILKYEPSGISEMAPHYDVETVTLLVYLNDEFEGGGTVFPRWRYDTGRPPAGTAILFPGGLSHVHAGRAIRAGTRRVLCGAYFCAAAPRHSWAGTYAS